MEVGQEMLESEKMKEIVQRNPFSRYIGMEILEGTQGYVRARIRLEPQLENIYGIMHGGCAYSLADTSAGIAAASYGYKVTTLNAAFNYMRPVAGTEYLYCEAKVQRSGAGVSVVRTELLDDAGKLLADGSFTFYHLGRKTENEKNEKSC